MRELVRDKGRLEDIVEYMIKRTRATAKMYSAAALFLFFLFLLWVEFSLYPYQKGFILPSIRFPIFR